MARKYKSNPEKGSLPLTRSQFFIGMNYMRALQLMTAQAVGELANGKTDDISNKLKTFNEIDDQLDRYLDELIDHQAVDGDEE